MTLDAPETVARDPGAVVEAVSPLVGAEAFAGLATATVYQVALGIVGVAILLTCVRLLRGPTLPDRVVAVDQLGFFAVGAIALYAVLTGQPVLLSVGIVMALILFLGTTAFAMFIERRARP